MDDKGDLYCTCDVGPFATCKVCSLKAADIGDCGDVPRRKKIHEVDDYEIEKIKSGWYR